MAPILGYWAFRGYGESIRYLLHYVGENFVDRKYDPKPVLAEKSWPNDKFNLGLDFPNLPYLFDGDLRITQSTIILRYFAKKHNLLGKTEAERVKVELAEQQIIDLRTNLVNVAYSQPSLYEELKKKLIESLPDQMRPWSKFLGNQRFLCGDSLTYVDFLAYDTFDFYALFYPTVYDDFPNIKEYLLRFERLPELQKYMSSPDYKRWPIFNIRANFGGSGPEPPRNF